MANSELVKFIKEQVQGAGVPLETVLESVEKAGWPKDEIEAAVNESGVLSRPEAEKPEPVQKANLSPNRKGKVVLLVDDSQEFLEIFSTKLKSSGFDVITALSGKEALEKLRGAKPDLILLDFKMPEMDGVETLAKIKEDPTNQEIKIAFLTSGGEPLPVSDLKKNDRKFAQEMGAKDFIQKSDDLDEVVGKINSILALNNS